MLLCWLISVMSISSLALKHLITINFNKLLFIMRITFYWQDQFFKLWLIEVRQRKRLKLNFSLRMTYNKVNNYYFYATFVISMLILAKLICKLTTWQNKSQNIFSTFPLNCIRSMRPSSTKEMKVNQDTIQPMIQVK